MVLETIMEISDGALEEISSQYFYSGYFTGAIVSLITSIIGGIIIYLIFK